MTHRALILAVSAVLAAGFLASDAEANHRKRMFYGYGYYQPPPPPAGYRYYDMSPEEFEQIFGDDDGYYYDRPVRKIKPAKKKKIAKSRSLKKKTVKSQAAAPKKTTKSVAAVKQTEPAKQPEPAPVTKKDPVKTAAAKATAAPQTETKSKAAVSCEKAGTILTGYGFSDIKPSICTGKEYTFDAARDGKTYAIKLNSANGELTEVRKLR